MCTTLAWRAAEKNTINVCHFGMERAAEKNTINVHHFGVEKASEMRADHGTPTGIRSMMGHFKT